MILARPMARAKRSIALAVLTECEYVAGASPAGGPRYPSLSLVIVSWDDN